MQGEWAQHHVFACTVTVFSYDAAGIESVTRTFLFIHIPQTNHIRVF